MKTSLILCLLYASVCFAALTINVEDVYVKLGEEVIIPCSYESDSDPDLPTNDTAIDDSIIPKFKWYHYQNGVGKRFYTYQDGTASGVTVKASAHKLTVLENGSLKVPVATWTVADNFGELACEVELGKVASTISEKFKLVVISIPKPDAEPATSQEENEEFDETTVPTIIGSCESPPSFPAGTITFFKNNEDGQSLSSKMEDSSIADIFLDPGIERPTPDGHRFITEKDLMKALDKSDHRAEFVCNVKVEVNDKILFETNKTMPVVYIRSETDMVEWAEKPAAYLGETITLRCNANGFPEPIITINGEEVAEKEITITENMNGYTYQCSATNSGKDVKSSNYTITVYKLDEPVITGEKLKDGKGTLKEGESATFGCVATGNPQPSLAWYDAKDAKVSDSGTLTITKVMMEDTARYTCRAYTIEHPDLQTTATLDVDVQGLRIGGEAQEVKGGKEGDIVNLECAVYANPVPTIEWNFDNGINLWRQKQEDSTETKNTRIMYTSQISVGPLTPEDSEKEYVCIATSEYGSVRKSFKMPEIKIETTTPAIAAASSGATTGIIIAVLLIILVIAIVVAVLYNKGIICKKQEKGDESAEGELDAAINNDERDLEAGNGKPDAPPVEEGHEPIANSEEEKLMNEEEIEK